MLTIISTPHLAGLQVVLTTVCSTLSTTFILTILSSLILDALQMVIAVSNVRAYKQLFNEQ